MKRAMALGLSSLVVGCGLYAAGLLYAAPSHAGPSVPEPTATSASAARALATLRQKRMVDTARNAFDDALARYAAGNATLEEVATWSRRTFQEDPDRASTTATTAYVDRAARIEKEVAKRVASGNAPKSDSLAAAYFRAEAEAAEAGALAQDRASGLPLDDPNGYR